MGVSLLVLEMPRFQFIGFPSEWGALPGVENSRDFLYVSNLLGSPASGEFGEKVVSLLMQAFPIYWVPQRVGRFSLVGEGSVRERFQFIGFPSEWGVRTRVQREYKNLRFQFIGFPSEWGA